VPFGGNSGSFMPIRYVYCSGNDLYDSKRIQQIRNKMLPLTLVWLRQHPASTRKQNFGQSSSLHNLYNGLKNVLNNNLCSGKVHAGCSWFR